MGASDSTLAELAAAQFGVFDLADARRCGFGRRAVARRLESRRWIRLYRGVYALGHAQLRLEGRWLAAVRACGPGAVLSHHNAATAWDLRPPRCTRIHVTVPFGVRRNPGRQVKVHETRALPPSEVTAIGPIPVTTVARTLLDLAPELEPRHLEAVISEADLRQIYDGRAVHAVLAAHPNRAGARVLRATLDRLAGAGVPRTRSEMEIRMRAFCDAYGLPQPAVNAVIDGAEVDFYWPGTAVIVETDSWRHHRMPGAREADAVKRLELGAAGYHVLSLTWDQITGHPRRTAAALRRVLG